MGQGILKYIHLNVEHWLLMNNEEIMFALHARDSHCAQPDKEKLEKVEARKHQRELRREQNKGLEQVWAIRNAEKEESKN